MVKYKIIRYVLKLDIDHHSIYHKTAYLMILQQYTNRFVCRRQSSYTPRQRRNPSQTWLTYRHISNISRTFSRQLNAWSLRCSWSIAWRRCSIYIFILDLTPSFNGLGKDNCKTRGETIKFWDLVRLILETSWYIELDVFPSWTVWTETHVALGVQFYQQGQNLWQFKGF